MSRYWKESNRPRPTKAIKEGETPLEYLLRLFEEGKLMYKEGNIYSMYDFRGKGKWRREPKLVGSKQANGYIRYSFRFNGSYYVESIHRIVYAYFHKLTNFPHNMVINHLDGNKANNKIENLELITQKENLNHAIDTGLRCVSNTNTAKLDWQKVETIRGLIKHKKHTHKDIAIRYGVHKSTIDRISQNRSWIRRVSSDKEAT